jgi:hypothetical protein
LPVRWRGNQLFLLILFPSIAIAGAYPSGKMIEFDTIITIAITATITSTFNTVTTVLLYKTLFKKLGITK